MAASSISPQETPTTESDAGNVSSQYPNLTQVWPLGNSDEGVVVE